MIQRIQSIFLALVAGASFSQFAFPFASVPKAETASALFGDGLYNIMDNPVLIVMFCLAGALALFNIFQFKNRKRQLSLNRILIIINLLGVGLAVFLFYQDSANVQTDAINDGVGLYLPIVAFVFVLLASRFIKKDENLVRSMDRLR